MKLVLYSSLAFYPIHWQALEQIVARYDVEAVVLAAPSPELPSVHAAHGTAEPGAGIEVRRMPAGSRRERVTWLARQLREVRPDAIWVQEEPIDPFLLEILALSRFSRRPRIVCSVCENIFPQPSSPVVRAARRALWPRIDRLIAVAQPSIDGIRAAGMPASVPADSLVAGGLGPPEHVDPLPLFVEGDFVVGVSGRIVAEKGWRVLADALAALPDEFKLAVAGDGPDLDALLAALPGRTHSVGLLPKDELWGFYAALDCLAVPSLTTPRWKEQLGGTLLDGLAMGVPVVASDSGALPDAMGDAGLIVPEGDPDALAAAIRRLHDDPALGASLAETGRERFHREFAIPAYADKIAAALELAPRS
ncbi:MAG TPA: glycosyltransferase family 4 protein [Gaiellaceae bacterium]|nr:glycosyltransferase family 4 protein [Gaiellaceae bacterium]